MGERGCYQHTRASEKHIQKLDNVTRVANYSLGGDPIPPYVRVYSLLPEDDSGCKPNCVGGDGNPGCAVWRNDGHATTPVGVSGCAGGDATVDFNCYHTTEGAFEDLSRCRKIGFKNAQAKVVWHGRFGYNSHDYPAGLSLDLPAHWDGSTWVGAECPFEALQSAADDTKYLQSTASASYEDIHYDISDGTTVLDDLTGTAGRTCTVDQYTGVTTLTGCSKTGPGSYGDLAWSAMGRAIIASPQIACNNLLALWVSNAATLVAGGTAVVTSSSYSDTTYDLTISIGSGDTIQSVSADFAAGSYTERSDYYPSGPAPVLPTYSSRVITWTNTHFSDVITTQGSTADCPGEAECWHKHSETVTGDLSITYTRSEVWTLAKTLLGLWDLADDKKYPWRTDPFYGFAPLVSYDGYPGPVSPDDTVGTCGWTDPNAGNYLAATVIGGPLTAGSQGFFDWNHITRRCCGDNIYYHWGIGAMSGIAGAVDPTDSAMPKTASQWTENGSDKDAWLYGHSNPWSPWAHHAGGVLRVQKWAEIKIHRPAINFFGPCGKDRFATSSTVCVTGVSGTTLTVNLTLGALSSDQCVVNDGTHSGLYLVSGSGTSYTLGTKLCELPAGAAVSNYSIGKVRWPAAWSICGRVGVKGTAVVSGKVQVTLSGSAPYLRTGDVLDFTNDSGTVTDASKTVTPTDDTFADGTTPDGLHFKYTDSSTPTGTWVKSHGAPDWLWYSTKSKGDFLWFTWEHNFRDIGEADRLCKQYADLTGLSCTASDPGGCVGGPPYTGSGLRTLQDGRGMPRSVESFSKNEDSLRFNVCWPQVVCFSPNGETFENGKTYDCFPDSPLLDDRYGYLWQAAVEFWMDDPLWQPPANANQCVSCADTGVQQSLCAFSEDDGTCLENACLGDCPSPDDDGIQGGVRYYPKHAEVEARMTLPDGAPDLPADAFINILSLAEIQEEVEPTGHVIAPPAGLAYTCGDVTLPDLKEMPWNRWLKEVHCVCTSGQFKSQYEDNGAAVDCPTI